MSVPDDSDNADRLRAHVAAQVRLAKESRRGPPMSQQEEATLRRNATKEFVRKHGQSMCNTASPLATQAGMALLPRDIGRGSTACGANLFILPFLSLPSPPLFLSTPPPPPGITSRSQFLELTTLGPYAVFGEVAVVMGGPRTASVIAAMNAEALEISTFDWTHKVVRQTLPA